MHKFTVESVDEVVTKESLKSINVTIPNNDGEYPTTKEFEEADAIAHEAAGNVIKVIDKIIKEDKLPNIQRDK